VHSSACEGEGEKSESRADEAQFHMCHVKQQSRVMSSPWDLHPFLHLHLLPTLSLPSPSAPIWLLGTHKLVKYGPMGFVLGADWARRHWSCHGHPIAFGGVWNYDQSWCGLDFDVAFSTGLLKSCKYSYMLLTYINVSTYLYFEKLQSARQAIPPFHFRVADITFYIENPHRFWKSVNGNLKTESHSH
jgi:hypothetical protein